MNSKNYLKSFFTEHWKYMTVSAACKLNIFDKIGNQSLSSIQTAVLLNLCKKETATILEALCQVGFLNKENELYSLNNRSIYLTESHPESLKYACMNWSGEHLNVWQELDYTIRTGNSAFKKKHGKDYFRFLNDNPDKLDQYHKAMYEYARDDYKSITELIDFSIHNSVMDVGGGYGAAIQHVKNNNSTIKTCLFDLDLVIQKSKVKNVEVLKGDFFIEIPKVADALILSRILHDWKDEKAKQILENCYKALPENGYLYIIENCSDKIEVDLSLLSLNMMAMCESFERSSYEYIGLANAANFKFKEAKQLNDLQTILVFKK